MVGPTADMAMVRPLGAPKWILHMYKIRLGRMVGPQLTTAALAGADQATTAPVAAPDRRKATSGCGTM
jgi:hypothetical protein